VFSWKTKRNLDPYFRVLYGMQMIAVLATIAGLGLVWWDGAAIEPQTAFDLLGRSVALIRERDPAVIGQPLVVLWFLMPLLVVAGVRAMIGLAVVPVSFRSLALVAWVLALLVLVHFHVNYGDDVPPDAPLKEGAIQPGFWLTGSSAVILGLLTLSEFIIREPDTAWASNQGPVDDAERLWRGEYRACPHCGMFNDPQAKTCYNCRGLLFHFDDVSDREERA